MKDIAVRCHGRAVGVLRMNPSGVVWFLRTNRRIPREHRRWDGRNTAGTNLSETTALTVPAWCRTCGEVQAPVAVLLDAYRRGVTVVLD